MVSFDGGNGRPNRMPTVTLRDARIIFRNFSGKEGQYNREGDRNFTLALLPEIAEDMLGDGWNVKQLRQREEDDRPQDILEVSLKYGPDVRPPQVVLITSGGRQTLTEHEIDILDWAVITKVDLKLNPYQWNVNGKTGVKAYLNKAFITIEEDDLDREYSQIPEAGTRGGHNEYTDQSDF